MRKSLRSHLYVLNDLWLNGRMCKRSWISVAVVLAAMVALVAQAQEVVLVQGTVSTPNSSERNYAVSVTKRLSRWMTGVSIPHRILLDEAVAKSSLRGVRVMILGYNPHLPQRERSALKRFVERGGKLIVFYSSDEGLADLMGLRLGDYKAGVHGNYWSTIRAVTHRAPLLPFTISQMSRNIRPVYPADAASQVVATWYDAKGANSGDPAIVESKHGMWISHVLLDDGDTEAKQRLLLTLVGHYSPSVWRAAAEATLPTRSAAKKIASVEALESRVDAKRRVAFRDAVEESKQLERRAVRLFEEESYRASMNMSSALHTALVKAYALAQSPRRGEFRGIWDHDGTGLYPGNWEKSCALFERCGITDVIANVLWAGLAHYPSNILPTSDICRNYGDQLRQCLTAAHRRGLRVHAWKVCWKLEGAPSSFIASLKRQGRLQVDASGNTMEWLCPSSAENISLEVGALREIAKRYPIDGVHLDYVRYHGSGVCCCNGCRKRFQKDYGKKLEKWPIPREHKKVRAVYDQWRCRRITHLVAEVDRAMKAIDPDISVSAAVFGKYPSCVYSVAQDWRLWLEKGYVDRVFPMNYTTDNDRFESLLKDQLSFVGGADRIIPGIGVTANESRLDAAMVINQIKIARKHNVPGWFLFDLNRTLEEETLPMLSLGITSD